MLPLAIRIFLSVTSRLAELTVVVVPDTLKLPVIVTVPAPLLALIVKALGTARV